MSNVARTARPAPTLFEEHVPRRFVTPVEFAEKCRRAQEAAAAAKFPADRIASRLGWHATALVQDALGDFISRRRAQLGEDVDPEAVVRDEVNPALKPLGMEVIVTQHDDGGVLNYSYSLWFPPFVRPVWGDVDMDEVRAEFAKAFSDYRDATLWIHRRGADGEVITERVDRFFERYLGKEA